MHCLIHNLLLLFFFTNTMTVGSHNKNELVQVLEKVLSDDSFKVKTPSTIEARKCAEELLTWCLDCINSTLLNAFNKTLADSLKKVIGAASTKSFAYNNEKLWRKFFSFMIQSRFRGSMEAIFKYC